MSERDRSLTPAPKIAKRLPMLRKLDPVVLLVRDWPAAVPETLVLKSLYKEVHDLGIARSYHRVAAMKGIAWPPWRVRKGTSCSSTSG